MLNDTCNFMAVLLYFSLILDNERWKQADVPTEFQELVAHISSTGCLVIPDGKTETGEFIYKILCMKR